ncbi:hypothetical protein Q3G72_012241 [Acer saccharum]|nr:hypothetical protein Q3G72_012241 [Acer saccharum]
MFSGDELQANTNRIVGTYGYMPPEYALQGLFSIKSDVFSFGVLLLETLSGKKNTGFYNTDSLNLLGHAWELWITDRAMDLKDPILENEASYPLLISSVCEIRMRISTSVTIVKMQLEFYASIFEHETLASNQPMQTAL